MDVTGVHMVKYLGHRYVIQHTSLHVRESEGFMKLHT